MIWSASTPSASALKLVKMRCRSTGRATARMSPALTARRPWRIARALAARIEVLGRARAGAPGQPVLDEAECAGLLGPGGPHQVHRVIDHVVAGRDLAHELLDPEHVAPREDRLDLLLRRLGRGIDDPPLLVPRRDSRC